MFACFGGERFWPLTADVAVFDAPFGTVVGALEPRPPRRLRRRTPGWPRYDDLTTAIAAAPEHAVFHVGTADGRTAVLATFVLDHFWLLGRGQHTLDCDLVWTAFVPAGRGIEPAARFGHYRRDQPVPADGSPSYAFTVDALRNDVSGWYFDRLGPARPYEEPEFYTRRVKADRLPFELLTRYAAAAGVPVGDPGFLTGPVAVRRRDAAPGLDHDRRPACPLRLPGLRRGDDADRPAATAAGAAGGPAPPWWRPTRPARRSTCC